MPSRLYTFFTGVVFLFFGLSGLVPSLIDLPEHRLIYYQMHMVGDWGLLYNWLAVNLVHDIIYIILGGLGVLAAITFTSAIYYCRFAFVITLGFIFIGLLPFNTNSLWGLLPLFGWQIMLHTVLCILYYYYGFIYPIDLGGYEELDTLAQGV